MHNLPSLADLQLFTVVVRLGTLARAADELGISRSAVSKRLASLEVQLGVKLLHRTTRRLVTTEDGETAFRWAQYLLSAVDNMGQELSARGGELCGVLRVSTSSGFGRNHVAPVLSTFATHHPALEIRLEGLDRPIDPASEGVDVDIRVGGALNTNLYGKRLASNRRVLCASPSYLDRHGRPKSLDELARHRCLVIRERDQPFGIWHLDGPTGPEIIRVRGTLSTNMGETAHRWALDGHGIVLRSSWDVAESLNNGQLERVLPDHGQEADVWAVYPTRLSQSPKVSAFVQLLGEHLTSLG